jgi:ubiquinone/menaquinone biosynthesis C-methylase UbiE
MDQFLIMKFVLIILAVAIVITQCRKPKWWVGRFFLWTMNRSHAGLTLWALKHVTIGRNDMVLDIGCGGGRTIQTLAAAAIDGKVYGIDYSAESVAASRRTNRESISAGRVDVQNGSVSKLPFSAHTFDLITAIETHYYWPDAVNDLQELLRVLKPGGSLLLVAEVYKRGKYDFLHPSLMRLLGGTCPSVRDQRDLFATAGFVDIETFEESNKGWFCGVARRGPPARSQLEIPS